MNKNYYDLVGKIMVDSFLSTWKDFTLTIYTEDELNIDSDRVEIIDIKSINQELQKYLDYIGDHRSRGFTYKVFSWIDAVKNSNEDWVLWIDADCACFKSPDNNLMEQLFPKDYICSYMKTVMYKDKNGWKDKHNCDSAIISFNTKTNFSNNFVNEFERLYVSKEINNREIFPKPNDTHAFVKCIEDAESNGYRSYNLNPDVMSLSPINHIILGDYFRHFKAGRKDKKRIQEIVNKLISSANKFANKPDVLNKRIERLDRKLRNA
jgi:hypothetical protein